MAKIRIVAFVLSLTLSGFGPLANSAEVAEAADEYFDRITIEGPMHILDGDTFEADLNGDGAIDLPLERVRLLYVDTPELGESHKGQDIEHGLPAKIFLETALQSGKATLLIPRSSPTGYYGRTLAIVYSGEAEINLALIRAGHSYFDTRFSFPTSTKAYETYATAEGAALGSRAGIWKEALSRKKYLRRLQKEKKTPRSSSNPRYGGGVFRSDDLNLSTYLGKYIRVKGQVVGVKMLRKGVVVIVLAGAEPERIVQAVAYRKTAERLGLAEWEIGSLATLEGFVKEYRGKLELGLHYGWIEVNR